MMPETRLATDTRKCRGQYDNNDYVHCFLLKGGGEGGGRGSGPEVVGPPENVFRIFKAMQ